MSPLTGTLILWDQGPTLMTSFKLIKALFQIQSHWGLGLQHMNLGGNMIQSITDDKTAITKVPPNPLFVFW